MTHAYDYVDSVTGIETNEAYPYKGAKRSCRFDQNSKVEVPLSKYEYTTQGNEFELKIALFHSGPVR